MVSFFKNSKFQIIILLIATFAVYCLFFGTKGFVNLQTNFTTTSGDFIKDYYNTYYHVKYDTSFLYNNTMNYPYGEHFTFTGDNSYISFPMILAKKLGFGDYSSFILLLINLHIFLSFLLCSLFLYLLFKEFKVPIWVAFLGAIIITFLSPQIVRMWGHLTLIYMFILPAMLYLFYKIYQTQRYRYAVFLGILTLWASLAHAYYFLFFFIFNVVFWGYLFICRKKENYPSKKMFYFICIQIIAPALLFFVLTSIGIMDSDRTKIPYGFHAYKGCWQATFLPSPYQFYWGKLQWSQSVSGMRASYIGLPAIVMTLILIVNICMKLVKRKYKQLLKITDNKVINLFFWISFITLIFSYGFPMSILQVRNFIYLGPLAQLRGLDRYQWLFFYLINIVTIYYAYHFIKEKVSKRYLQIIFAALIFCAYSFEVYSYNRSWKTCFNKEWSQLTDYDNTLEENQWVKNIDTIPFQSVIYFPFFHIGSEHIWISDINGALEKVVYVSMKTGLPMHDCHSSRTSISKTYKNVAFTWSPPLNGYSIFKDMDYKKPILIITPSNKEGINENEQRIIDVAVYLFSANDIDFYRIDVQTIEQVGRNYFVEQLTNFSENKKYHYRDNLYGNKDEAQFYFYQFNKEQTFPENGKKEGMKLNIRKVNNFLREEVHFQNTDSIEISFWISNFTDDFVARSVLYLSLYDSEKSNFWYGSDIFRDTKNLYNGWALVRKVVPYNPDYPILNCSLECQYSRNKDVFIDFILIRPLNTDILYENEQFKMINNEMIWKKQ